MNTYQKDIAKQPKIDDSEIEDLLSKHLMGDTKAREKLIYHYMPIVFKAAKSLYRENFEDLVSIGNEQLINAIDRTHQVKANQLGAFIALRVRTYMIDYIRRNNEYTELSDIDIDRESYQNNNCTALNEILAVQEKIWLSIAFAALKDQEREILTLTYGLSNTNILNTKKLMEKYKASHSTISLKRIKAEKSLKKAILCAKLEYIE